MTICVMSEEIGISYGYIKILCKPDKCEVLKRERVVWKLMT